MQELEALDDALVVPLDLMPAVFTRRRTQILSHLRRHGPVATQAALAKALGRAPSHVSVDINYLEGLGLVDRRQGVRATRRPILVD